VSLVREELDRHHRTLKQRRGWLRKLLRPLPRRANVARYPVIKWFAGMARRLPFLWSFRKQHVLPALYLGCVLSLLPVYGIQFGLALVFALLVRGNITVLMGLQLITNPFTAVPAYILTYKVGMYLIAITGIGHGMSVWGTRANALVIGGIVLGVLLAVLIHVVWLFAAWEGRRIRARVHYLREALAAEAAGQQPPPKP
jgi:hypothetical protein